MLLFPAIDLSEGKAVRLLRGDFAQKTVFADDPVAVAKKFYDEGARQLHMVDLSGAKAGAPAHLSVLRAVREALPGVFIQWGGGLRTRESVESAFRAGASRVILGTAAVENEALLRDLLSLCGDQIAVGVDAREGKVALRGWLTDSGEDGVSLCARLAALGARTAIYTDIARDGAMQGPAEDCYKRLISIPNLNVIASGGVSSLDDLARLKALGVHGAITGRALYEGAFTVAQALAVCGEGSV